MAAPGLHLTCLHMACVIAFVASGRFWSNNTASCLRILVHTVCCILGGDYAKRRPQIPVFLQPPTTTAPNRACSRCFHILLAVPPDTLKSGRGQTVKIRLAAFYPIYEEGGHDAEGKPHGQIATGNPTSDWSHGRPCSQRGIVLLSLD